MVMRRESAVPGRIGDGGNAVQGCFGLGRPSISLRGFPCHTGPSRNSVQLPFQLLSMCRVACV